MSEQGSGIEVTYDDEGLIKVPVSVQRAAGSAAVEHPQHEVIDTPPQIRAGLPQEAAPEKPAFDRTVHIVSPHAQSPRIFRGPIN